ncbi:MAG: DPP IV N-terminal domain-containing protein [Verrucomicrobiota bacterium]|nr:DPP IV N-terminal domain-containing protein [Verrucomicrobiota bacterium]
MQRVLLVAAVLPFIALPADKKKPEPGPLLSLERIYAKKEFSSKGYSLKWLESGQGYVRQEKSKETKDAKDIVQYAPATGKKKILVAAKSLIPKGKKKPLTLSSYTFTKDLSKVLIFTNTKRVWRRDTRGDYWVLDRSSGKLQKLGGKAKESTLMFAKFSPANSNHVAYVRDKNVYVEDLESGQIRVLTKRASDTVINGTFDWVYEEELGLRDGFRWSPDGKAIAYWQLDEQGVPEMNMLNNVSGYYPKLITFRYPKTGETNAICRVGVVQLEEGTTTWMKVPGDPRNHYLARMEWAENSDELLLQQLNRLQNQNKVMLADAHSGEVKAVYTDEDKAWIEVRFGFTRWIEKGKRFTYVSEREGWRQLYLVSRDGKTVLKVTDGKYDIIRTLKVDKAEDLLYFIASPNNATERYLYRIGLNGKGLKRLSPADQTGSHSYNISPDAKWALHTFSNIESPPVTNLIELYSHKVIRVMEKNQSLRGKLEKLKRPKAEFFRINIDKGVSVDAYAILPPELNPNKKYPLLVYVYGEPAGQTTVNSWRGSGGLWHWMLAQQGYVVMSIDNRGTTAPRGNAWRKSIYRQVGILASKDQAAAVKQVLKNRPYLDADRVGVWGWSGGGSMTLNALFRYPELYNTGISIAPVPNQRLYDTIYQERYMGLPKDNKEGYKNGSPITFAKNLKGKLLLVHGTTDDNVHYQGMAKLIDELVANKKQFEMLAYPNRSHSIREGRNTTMHLRTAMTDYLRRTLPSGPQ